MGGPLYLFEEVSYGGNGVATKTDEVQDDTAELQFLQERFALRPRHELQTSVTGTYQGKFQLFNFYLVDRAKIATSKDLVNEACPFPRLANGSRNP